MSIRIKDKTSFILIHCFRFFFFLFLFLAVPDVSNSSSEVKGQPKKRFISSVNNKVKWLSKKQEVQLGGVLIVFHKWPKKSERRKIFLETKKEYLKKTESVSKPKMWSFEWLNSKNKSLKNLASFKTALEVCDKLKKLDSVRYCRLEFIPILHKGFSQQDSMIHSKTTETNCTREVFDIKEDSSTSHPPKDNLWGQKMIGSDLAREAMEGVNNLPEKDSQRLLSILDANIDVGFGTHEELVRSVAVGQGDQAVSAPVGKTDFYNYKRIQEHIFYSNEVSYNKCLSDSSKLYCQRRYFPAIANISGGLIDSESFIGKLKSLYQMDRQQLDSNNKSFDSKLLGRNVDLSRATDREELTGLLRALERNFESPTPFYLEQDRAIERMSERGSIIVQSAGNKGNKPIDEYAVKAAREYGAIVVGSVNSRGDRADFSQTGQSVFIMAPGENLTVSNDKGEFHQLDGTSFSAPMVSGALKNFILASGYRPTSEEAKILLKETSIPHNAGLENGEGIVNAYKMVLVGKRLYELCGSNESCISKRMRQPSTYLFKLDPAKLLSETEIYFPQCSSQSPTSSIITVLCDRNCAEKAEILKRLREYFLLNPNDSQIAEYLACIYSSHGYEDVAKFHLRSGSYGYLQQALKCGRQPSYSNDGSTRSTDGVKVSQ